MSQVHRVIISEAVLDECARRFRGGETLRLLEEYAGVNHETLRRQLQAHGVDTSRGPRQFCMRGHAWMPENVYTAKSGYSTCRICARLAKARNASASRSEIKAVLARSPEPLPARHPVRVPWWRYECEPWQADLRGEVVLRAAVRAFIRCRSHWPTIVLVAAENVCKIGGDVVVRASNGRTEPEPGTGEVYLR